MLPLLLILFDVVNSQPFPTGNRCGSEFSLTLCPDNLSDFPGLLNQTIPRGPGGNAFPNQPFVPGNNGFHLGSPCQSDDDCRQLEASCLPFPEVPNFSQSGNAYFSNYLIQAGLPPPTSNVCRCVFPKQARFSLTSRQWVCRSEQEVINDWNNFAASRRW